MQEMTFVFEPRVPECGAWQKVWDRARVVSRQKDEVQRTLASSDASRQAQLQAKLAALTAENDALAAQSSELARQYALAHLAFLRSEHERLQIEWQTLTERLQEADSRRAALMVEERRALAQFKGSLPPESEAREIHAPLRQLDDEVRHLRRDLATAEGARDAQAKRANDLYRVPLTEPEAWPAAAQEFGQAVGRYSDHVRQGRMGGSGPRPAAPPGPTEG